MSAARIIRRRGWRAAKSTVSWHDHAVAAGYRHPSFQRTLRRRRADYGLAPTSTDMHRLHGTSA